MSDIHTRTLLDTEMKQMMVPADKVAFVYFNHSLEHALLILTRSGYSAIPVLDEQSAVRGVITATLIMNAILGVDRYEVEKLSDYTIETVMSTDMPRVKENERFFRALELSINWPFICVESVDGKFVGILARKAILALLYQYIRQTRD